MMVGDSVPARLGTAFERAFTPEGWRFVTAALGGCPPTGETPVRPDGAAWPGVVPGCRAEVAKRQDALIGTADPELIVWWDRFSVSGFRDEDGTLVQAGSARFWSLRAEALDATVRRLGSRGAIVVFVGAEPPAESVLRALSRGRLRLAAVPDRALPGRHRAVESRCSVSTQNDIRS